MESIQKTIENDVTSFPSWITEHKSTAVGKIASSSNDMKIYLRHVAFPHVLASYGRIIDEMCASEEGTSETATPDAVVAIDAPSVEASSEPTLANGGTDRFTRKVKDATLRLPMHTAPICAKPDGSETAVDDFFRGLVSGHGGEGDNRSLCCNFLFVCFRVITSTSI